MSMLRKSVAVFVSVLAGLAAAATPSAPEALDRAVLDYAGRTGAGAVVHEFHHALTDLDGDGVQDAVVLLIGRDWCGTGGCTLLVLKGKADGFVPVSDSSISEEPIRVSKRETHHGWKTIIVHSRGAGEALLRFDGKKYPDNPSMQPMANPGQLKDSTILLR